MEEHLEDVLIIVFFVFERPARLENEAFFLGQDRELAVGIEFERGIGGIDLAEEKIGLLRRYLVRERDRLGKRDVDMALGGEKRIQQPWIVLEEGFFDAPCRLREKGKSQEERKNADGRHFPNGITEISPGARALRREFSAFDRGTLDVKADFD
jgi:hypothetical protein